MKIYIAHSREFDFKTELYNPIRQAQGLPQAEIVLPHEFSDKSDNTREFYDNLDLMIAEVSYPATGLGMELGWAFDSKVPIVCIYRHGKKFSGSCYAVTDQFYEYETPGDLPNLIAKIIEQCAK